MKNKIYKISIALFLVILSAGSLFAQVEITGYGGYACADRFDYYYGSGKVQGGGLFGASIGLETSRGSMLEFMWQHTSPTMDLYDYYYDGHSTNTNIGVNIDYFTLNFGYSRNDGDSPVSPFACMMLGGVNISAKDYNQSAFLFNPGLEAGVKIFPSDVVGIRLQAALMMPVQGFGGGFGCAVGTGGSGCGTSVTTYTTITQMTFSGGIVLKLDK